MRHADGASLGLHVLLTRNAHSRLPFQAEPSSVVKAQYDYNAAAEGELEIGPIIDGVRLGGTRLVTRPGLGGRNSWLRSRKLCPSKSPCFSSDWR